MTIDIMEMAVLALAAVLYLTDNISGWILLLFVLNSISIKITLS